MFYLETVYKASNLNKAWEKIPTKYKDKIAMDLEGGQKLTGWDQFVSIYDDFYLAYKDLNIAENRFIYIFLSNIFILEQISKYKDQIICLLNMDNWKDVTTTISIGDAEGQVKNSAATSSKSSDKTDNLNKLGIKRSDSNSFAPEGDKPPYNQFEDQDNLIASNTTNETQNLDYSVNNSESKSKSASKTESSNNAKDCLLFLQMEMKNLYDKFWKKFSPLFLFNC